MNHDSENGDSLAALGEPSSLPVEMEPPIALEDRVVNALVRRGMIRPDRPVTKYSLGWRAVRASLAAAACATILAVGVFIGRASTEQIPGSLTNLTGAETDLYALLLFETDSYDRPSAQEALTRYGEYSEWIALAREREQFVTGEDFDADRGWLIAPEDGGVAVSETVRVAGGPPLSGVLFVRADHHDDALRLARALPHVRHGGSVLVQKTIRTDVPTPEPTRE